MLIRVDTGRPIRYDRTRPRNEVPDTLDAQIVRDAQPFFRDGEKMQLSYAIQNTQRSIGARVSSHIVRKFGMRNRLQPDHLTVVLTGSAGQSLGAFAAPGLKLVVHGDANDYVGKGLSGGTIVLRPHLASRLVPPREHDHRQHRALWRDRGPALRRGPGRRKVLRAQFGRRGGGRGLRVERLRIHDRRHRGDPGPGRRQFRRRHDRRHGLRAGCRWRLRPPDESRDDHRRADPLGLVGRGFCAT
ncbi:MAG: hypothetical protein KatS3mg118_3732 [Paracoccaceae bacterium]|nr:MAG: hypothetical protein KatS3mg118_3732 [Paracoccaceae bacterium]